MCDLLALTSLLLCFIMAMSPLNVGSPSEALKRKSPDDVGAGDGVVLSLRKTHVTAAPLTLTTSNSGTQVFSVIEGQIMHDVDDVVDEVVDDVVEDVDDPEVSLVSFFQCLVLAEICGNWNKSWVSFVMFGYFVYSGSRRSGKNGPPAHLSL